MHLSTTSNVASVIKKIITTRDTYNNQLQKKKKHGENEKEDKSSTKD